MSCRWFPQECSQPRTGETPSEGAERRELAVAALRALALDYDVGDHDILKGSILLEVYTSFALRVTARFSLEDMVYSAAYI